MGHWPEEWWDWVAQDWASKAPDRTVDQIRDRIEPGLIDPDGSRMVERMDAAGVDISVLLPIDWGLDYTARTPISDAVGQMLDLQDRHPGRLIAFGGIDPRRSDAVQLVTDWFDRGARGLKLYPGCGWDPMSPEAIAVYELCQKYNYPVLFHTGDPLPLLDTELSNPLLLLEIPRRFPELRLWLGHAGAPNWWDQALTVAEAGPNVRLEMSVWVWDDSDEAAEIDLARKVIEAGRRLGYDRIIYGTDHVSGQKVRPAGFLSTVTDMYRRLPVHCERLGTPLSEENLAAILGGTAARDLGLANP